MPRARLLLLLLLLSSCAEPEPQPPAYQFGTKTRDGIGKYYMGREIAAYIMGHGAIRWLERPEREKEEQPARLVEALELKPADVVADVGAGSGYMSFRMAPQVAKVLAVEIQQEMIDFLRKRARELEVPNVEAVLGTPTDPKLPPGGVDLVLMVDVYHELDHPVEMMMAIRKALRRGGRVVLVEYRAEDPNVPMKPLHKMTVEQAKLEMATFGLKWVKTVDVLPWQHILVFSK